MTARWMAALLMAATALPGWAQSQHAIHFDVTADQIARTLSGRGVQIAEDRISLLANVVATEAHPMLDVLSVEPLAGRWAEGRSEAHSLVKLACRVPGTCLPFYVIVNAPEGASASAAASAVGSPTATESASANSALAVSLSAQLKPNAAITIRAGSHAVLILDDERARIRVTVISLENGHTGDKIHVASPDHKQLYVAEVVGANLLKRSY